MSILGIITEYNPFHNGHLYHLQQSKKITGAEAVICIMNGNFVQRGRPAVTDKWSRTKMALANGVDLVIELPLIYGIRSAEYFAEGAVRLLGETNIVDNLVFGSEIGEIDPLAYLAEIFLDEPESYQKHLKKNLGKGFSFPEAREKALFAYLDSCGNINLKLDNALIQKVISEPNNILGIEYLKALKRYNIEITPLTIRRSHKNYHSQEVKSNLASATAIRKKIYNNKVNFSEIKYTIPSATMKILERDMNEGKIPIKREYLGILVLSSLRQMTSEQLTDFAEIDEGLANRMIDAAYKTGSLNQLISAVKTRAFTWTRVQRNLLHILFKLKSSQFKKTDYGPGYFRVLGFTKNGEKLLTSIKRHSTLPIITQPAGYLKSKKQKSKDFLKRQLSFDILASDLYSLLYKEPEKRGGHLDFYNPVIKI
ncbi:MAG: nucleotidyltransferase [bacterium]